MSVISIVVPTYNEEGSVDILFRSVKDQFKDKKFEIIYVDDGSSDRTLEILKRLSKDNSEVRYISFSRNFGHQAALRAGIKIARGDAVISMDADMQHPPALIPLLISKWEDEKYDIVYTVRKDTVDIGVFKKFTSILFYRLLNFLSGLNIEDGAADFRLIDRKIVDLINSQIESDMFLRGYINWIGFKQIGIPYEPAKRFSGTRKYTLKKMMSLAGTGITQFSIKPLRLALGLAMAALLLSFFYVIYAIFVAIGGGAVPGWLSLVTLFVFLQGIQFLLIGLVGEYIGRMFLQTKYRPDYIIAEGSDDKK